MEEFILIILNTIILFFILKFLIKITKKKMQNCNINKLKETKSKIGGYMIILSIINLWLTILGEFHIVFYIIFIAIVGCIVFIGALTEG